MNIGAVLLFVDDFEAAVSFYRDAIGLTVAEMDPGAGYRPMVDFAYLESEGAALEIFDQETHGAALAGDGAGRTAIGFNTSDVAEARTKLVGAGAEPGPIVERDWGSYIDVRDPEGNPLQVYQFAE